ncbi:MAG: SIS domain-containing protein [Chloroflexaceae bacterium]|nr:SIS domain-containing protein [Chloroflexaceae bacterium]
MERANQWHHEVLEQLEQSAEVMRHLASEGSEAILAAADLLAARVRAGGKVLLCGNGGSAADCQHMAAELVGRLSKALDRPAIPALALTTDTSFLTAFANDFGFEGVFARQVQALGKPGDILVGISTSGHSANVVRAVEQAHRSGIHTVGLLGNDGGILAPLVDVRIVVPGPNTQRIQEGMLAVEHILCYLVERYLFQEGRHP